MEPRITNSKVNGTLLYRKLRNSNYELGYFINFSAPKLFMKRIIFTNDRKFHRHVLSSVLLLFVVLSSIFVAFRVNAATAIVYFDGPAVVAAGEEFIVKILVDT